MKRVIALLGWLGVALVLAAVVVRFAKPDAPQVSQGLAIAGLAVTLIYTLTQWRDIARSFQGRNVRYGSMTAGSVVLVLAILVGINWIGNREDKHWDLTANKTFSLSDQTKKILHDLKKPVSVKVFYGQGQLPDFKDRLTEYADESSQFNVEYIDAERNPERAKQYAIQQLGTVVLEYEGRTERAQGAQEQDLTNALIKVIEGKVRKMYFVQGHGEHDVAGTDPTGYATLAGQMKNDNFEADKFVLAQEGKVPDDATLVVIAGPKTDYLPPEIDALRAYLKKGGKLILLIDPPGKEMTPQPNLIGFAKEWNIVVGNDIIVDTSAYGRMIGTDASVPIGFPTPVAHPITTGFRVITAFPLARSVTPATGATDRVPQALIQTSKDSWSETDIKGLYATGQPKKELDKGDKAGPIDLAVAVSAPAPDAPAPVGDAPKPETRMVVVGDSDFVENAAIGIQGNEQLFENMANWTSQEENLIAIHPHDPEDRRITLTEDQSQRIFWVSLLIIPGLFFANAFRVWWRRR